MSVLPSKVFFLATKKIFQDYFYSGFVRLFDCIPIYPKGVNKQSFTRAILLLEQGKNICIFPEGKISLNGNMQKVKKGVSILVKQSNAEVIPFAIEGAYEALPFRKGFPRLHSIEIRFGAVMKFVSESKDEMIEDIKNKVTYLKKTMEKEGFSSVLPKKLIWHLICK